MALDRDETLRKAEKLLRQGNLANAITEYARVADAYPSDAPTLNKLGELYQRAGQTQDAIAQFARVADQWLREGNYAKAASHYKKILKLNPQDESAILQLVQASIRQGQLGEAKTYLQTARAAREARGDAAGAEDLTLQLSDLDPTDFDARLTALRVRLARDATPELVAEVRRTIAELERQGRGAETEVLLASLIRLDPDDVDARVRVARAAMQRGEMDAARAALPAHAIESQRYEVLAMATELELTAGNLDAGRPLLQRLLVVDREHAQEDIAALGERLRAPDLVVTFACVETLADDHATAREFAPAADRLKRFLKRSPHHVPALLRLVEVGVDGDLDADVTFAQSHLADAYLQQGEAMKARIIAEDLLSRRPRSARQRDRLRRALVALGDEDPDATIADHLGFVEDLTDEAPEVDDEPALIEEEELVAAASAAEDGGVAVESVGLESAGAEGIPPESVAVEGIEIEQPASDSEPVFAEPGVIEEPAVGEVSIEAAVVALGDSPIEDASIAEGGPEDSPVESAATAAAFFDSDEPDLGLAASPGEPGADILFEPLDLAPWEQDPAAASGLMPDAAAAGASDVSAVPEFADPVGEPASAVAVSSQGAAAGSDAAAAGPEATAASPAPSKGRKKGKKAGATASAPTPEPKKPVTDEIDLTGALNALARGDALGQVLAEADPDGVSAASSEETSDADEDTEAEADAPGGTDASATHASGLNALSPGQEVGQTNGVPEDVDLEQVFDGLRAEAAGDMVDMAQPDQSARLLSMAETYQAAGMFEEARAALEQVSSDARYRFRAAAALGQLFWQQGDADASLRWLELASEAPAPDREAGRAVMYDLAEKLEQTGDTTRALAVFLDLLAEQDDYRDVRARVDHLTRVQAGR